MTVWTILVITILSGPMEGAVQALLYRTKAECEAATRAVGGTFSYDYKMECRETEVLTDTPRPKRNPRY